MARPSRFPEYIQKLQKYYHHYRCIPSFGALTEILGVQSKRTIHRFFQQCIERDYLYKHQGSYIPTARLIGIPIYHAVPAGTPEQAREDKLDDIDLQAQLVTNPESTIIVHAQGDSMIDAGILSGDMLLVDTKTPYYEGNIVIGIVDQEYTVKYLRKDQQGKRYLQPANSHPEYQDIYPQGELRIYGVVTSVIRTL